MVRPALREALIGISSGQSNRQRPRDRRTVFALIINARLKRCGGEVRDLLPGIRLRCRSPRRAAKTNIRAKPKLGKMVHT